MLKHKHIDKICILIVAAALAITVLFTFGESLGLKKSTADPPYVSLLFDDTKVQQIELFVDDWEGFIDRADEEYVSCDAVINGKKIENAGLRVKGNNSRSLVRKYGHTRHSLKLEFDHYVSGGSFAGLDKLNLDSSFQDNSYMKNYLALDMMRHMGVATPLTSYAQVKVNGQNIGLYLAVEEPEEAFAKRNFGKNYGKLYKPDYRRLEDPNQDVALQYTGDSIGNYDNIFRNQKFKTSDEDKRRLIESLQKIAERRDLEEAVDIEQVMRYFAVQVFVVNLDSYLGPTGHNYFLYEEDGRLQMLPWDYNLAFATYSLGMPDPINDSELYVNYPIDTPASGDIMVNRPMFHNLMLNADYFETYHKYFDQLISTYFESGYFEKKVAAVRQLISPYVKTDPTAYCSYADYETGVKTITDFCLLRAESVRGQLNGEIPSTIKGQQEDSSKRIDASGVWLPDMGEIADLKD